jgi:hypothetical protein
MAHCFFIGIGGTGAKCAEAMIHLSAAGLGPDSCTLMLVDQDEPNGNGERCKRILGDYINLRGLVRDTAEGILPPGALFRTDISGGDPWRPTAHPGETLGEICGYDGLVGLQKDLMDCLYLEREREQNLDKGFRAHSSVGAAVLVWQTFDAGAFWRGVIDSIHRAYAGQQVKVFLLGSIFGGTGAAGFPTIARLIRQALAPPDRQATGILARMGAQAADDAVQIGGALMLPYFAFPPPPSGSGELLPDSSAFLEQTRGALTYYVRLLSEQRLFDRLYLVGWQPLLEIGPYSEGGREQTNPALLPELYAALAALQYFAIDEPAANNALVSYFRTADDREVEWADLPQLQPRQPYEIRNRLGQFIRMAHAYHAVYRPALSEGRLRVAAREVWFRRLIDGAGLTKEALDNFEAYSHDFLQWAANVAFGAAVGADVRLYQAGQFATPTAADGRFAGARLLDPPLVDRRSFRHLIVGEDGPDLPTVFDSLTYGKRVAGREGLGVFLRQLHEACSVRNA